MIMKNQVLLIVWNLSEQETLKKVNFEQITYHH